MNKNLGLVYMFVLVSMSITASDMESVLEVGRENQQLSATSQEKN